MPLKRVLSVICGIALASSVLAAQKEEPKTTDERLRDLETKGFLHDFTLETLGDVTGSRSATLDCDSGKFQYAAITRTSLTLLVACTSIAPYREGFRISLNVGNPYTFRFTGFTATLFHGADWAQAYKQKVAVDTTSSLMPGVWTEIIVNVPVGEAKEFRVMVLDDLSIRTAAPR